MSKNPDPPQPQAGQQPEPAKKLRELVKAISGCCGVTWNEAAQPQPEPALTIPAEQGNFTMVTGSGGTITLKRGERVEGEMTQRDDIDLLLAWRKDRDYDPSEYMDFCDIVSYARYYAAKVRDQLAERDATYHWLYERVQECLEMLQPWDVVGEPNTLVALVKKVTSKLSASESREQRLREALRESTWMLTNLAGLAQRSGHNVEHVDKQVIEVNGPLLEALNPSPAKDGHGAN